MIDEQELKSKLATKIANSLGNNDEISSQREENLRRYNAELYGDEQAGRSKVLTTECRDTILWLLPSVVKTFLSSDRIVEFKPQAPGTEDLAEQQTDFINYLVTQREDAFSLLYIWFLDCLISKNGYTKYGHELKIKKNRDTYTGIDEMSLDQLLHDENIEIESCEEIPQNINNVIVQTYNVTIVRTKYEPDYFIENIAPENVLVNHNAKSIDDATFIGIIYHKTASDLVEMGFDRDLVESLPKSSSTDYNSEAVSRNDVNNKSNLTDQDDYVEIIECYVKIDEDDDGIAELRRIIVCGRDCHEILEDEEIDEIPLAPMSPFLKPYSFFGDAIIDYIKDLQRINTSLWRQMLDYVYNSVQPMWEVFDTGIVNINDVLRRTPGGLVRVKQLNTIKPILNAPMDPQTFTLLDRLKDAKDVRTGVVALNQGLEPNAINKTWHGQESVMEAGRQLQDLIVRTFAETGVKRLFKGLYGLVVKHQNQPLTVRLRNKWVAVDPRDWDEQVKVQVNVGLGTASTQIKELQLNNILQKQVQFSSIGISNPKQIYNTLARLAANAGYKDVDSFFTDPSTLPPPPSIPPIPTPEEIAIKEIDAGVEKAVISAEAKKHDTDTKAEVELVKNQTDVDLKLMSLEQKQNNNDFFLGVPD